MANSVWRRRAAIAATYVVIVGLGTFLPVVRSQPVAADPICTGIYTGGNCIMIDDGVIELLYGVVDDVNDQWPDDVNVTDLINDLVGLYQDIYGQTPGADEVVTLVNALASTAIDIALRTGAYGVGTALDTYNYTIYPAVQDADQTLEAVARVAYDAIADGQYLLDDALADASQQIDSVEDLIGSWVNVLVYHINNAEATVGDIASEADPLVTAASLCRWYLLQYVTSDVGYAASKCIGPPYIPPPPGGTPPPPDPDDGLPSIEPDRRCATPANYYQRFYTSDKYWQTANIPALNPFYIGEPTKFEYRRAAGYQDICEWDFGWHQNLHGKNGHYSQFTFWRQLGCYTTDGRIYEERCYRMLTRAFTSTQTTSYRDENYDEVPRSAAQPYNNRYVWNFTAYWRSADNLHSYYGIAPQNGYSVDEVYYVQSFS